MTRRRTVGQNPLDLVVPPPGPPASEVSAKPRKRRLTVHLPLALIERVKNCVFWTPGLTLAALAETALSKAVDQREKERGEPFPLRGGELKGGRPLK